MSADGGTVYVGATDDGEMLGVKRDCKPAGRGAGRAAWPPSLTNAVRMLGAAAAANVAYERAEFGGRTAAKITARGGAGHAYMDPKNRGMFAVRQGAASALPGTKEAGECNRERLPKSG